MTIERAKMRAADCGPHLCPKCHLPIRHPSVVCGRHRRPAIRGYWVYTKPWWYEGLHSDPEKWRVYCTRVGLPHFKKPGPHRTHWLRSWARWGTGTPRSHAGAD